MSNSAWILIQSSGPLKYYVELSTSQTAQECNGCLKMQD